MPAQRYTVLAVEQRPEIRASWDGAFWGAVPALAVAHFRPEGSGHRPPTHAKLVYCPAGLCGIFRVHDRFVRCLHTRFQDPVCRDSCVEFFVQPRPDGGYFNFEFNCGGALLAAYILDPTRVPGGFREFKPLAAAEARHIAVASTLPPVVAPEIAAETLWHLGFFIPFGVLRAFAGELDLSGRNPWRANFFKCADDSSHPHWGAWAPVDALNFHLPRCFGTLDFQPPAAPKECDASADPGQTTG